ncbi:MAG: hypothetical protein HYZ38_06925 [Mycobacterium sp.]|nr:hypothetical protein [Mycobacterium sp.]
MNGITLNEARSRAQAAIEEMAGQERLGKVMIIDDAIIETDRAWYFPYDAVAFVLEGDFSSALAGNLPVRVSRDGEHISFEEPT